MENRRTHGVSEAGASGPYVTTKQRQRPCAHALLVGLVHSFNAAHGSFDSDSGLLYAADTGAGCASALVFDPETGFEIRWVEEQTMSVFQQVIDAPDRRVLVTNELVNVQLNPLAARNEQVVFRDAATGRAAARTEELSPRMSQGANISPGFHGRVHFPGTDGKIYEVTVRSE
jgi:hypothetical protein